MFDVNPIGISLKTAITATAITFVLAVFTARWMFGYRGKGRNLIESFLTAPLVLPPTVVGFILLLLLGKNGYLGRILDLLGIRIVFSWFSTVIAATVVSFPLMYRASLAAFMQIDPNLIAAARTLGASETKIFLLLMLPLARPGIISGIILTFARSLGEFGATLMVAGSIPGKTQTIAIAIFLAAESGEMDRAIFLVAVMLLISLGVIFILNSQENSKSGTRDRFKLFTIPYISRERPSQIISRNNKTELVVDIQKQLQDFVLDVSFVTSAQPLGILGASGAGKSTILRCIAGLETPDKGRIVLNGKVLFDSHQKINLSPRDRNCGFLFQDYALFPHLSVAENIAFAISGNQSSRQIKQIVTKQLIDVELPDMGDRYPEKLSGGEKQRVALARARASNPQLMLLDEPFSALDTYLRHKQEKILRQNLSNYGGATLFITHNLEEAYRICPNLLVIDQGKIIASGTKYDIFERPGNVTAAKVTNCKNFSRAVAINSHTVRAIDWNITLEVSQPIPPNFSQIGIRAHQLIFTNNEKQANTFSCWLAGTSETQHRMTLYLKLHQPANNSEDYHLQAEVFKDKWRELHQVSCPWKIQLHPTRILLLYPD